MSEEVDPISTEQTAKETQDQEPTSTETATASTDPPPTEEDSSKDPPASTEEDSSKDPPASTEEDSSKDPPASIEEGSSKDPPASIEEGSSKVATEEDSSKVATEEDSSQDPPPSTEEGSSQDPPPSTEEGSSPDPPPPTTDPPAAAAAEAPPPTEEAPPRVERASQPQLNMVGVIIGGTGATGRSLVSYLLRSKKEEWSKIILFSRRAIDNIPDVNLEEEKSSGRLVEHIVDMFNVPEDEIKSKCEGADVFFCCLGTTRRDAGSAEAFVRIDRDIVVRFAQQAKAAGIPHFSLLTSIGSNPNSFFLYTKTKGQVEEEVRQLNFSYTTILRPGLLGRGDDRRLVEKFFGIFLKAIPVETVAQGMAIDAYQYKGSSSGATAADNVVIMANSDIYRTVQGGQ